MRVLSRNSLCVHVVEEWVFSIVNGEKAVLHAHLADTPWGVPNSALAPAVMVVVRSARRVQRATRTGIAATSSPR